MPAPAPPSFDTADLFHHLRQMSPRALDQLDLGVVGVGPEAGATVTHCNATEQPGSGLPRGSC